VILNVKGSFDFARGFLAAIRAGVGGEFITLGDQTIESCNGNRVGEAESCVQCGRFAPWRLVIDSRLGGTKVGIGGILSGMDVPVHGE
jgi:hypothetical protein